LDAAEVVSGSDICVLCTPIGAMPPLAREIAPLLDDTATVTDVGSVKAGVVSQLEPIFGGKFVGSHPMAGSEQSGITAARANLFDGAVCILTPTNNSVPDRIEVLRDLWECVGCRIVEMSPREHDECIACVSHLPHAIAATLVSAIHLRIPNVDCIAGGGYRDTTRIAGGPAAMWREILLENRTALLAGLEDFTTTLETMKELIRLADSAELELFLERARAIRQDLS
jgi:prephenate dehydrogenase